MNGKSGIWQRVSGNLYQAAEAFLREREFICVGACSRFLPGKSSHDHCWVLLDKDEVTAFLLQSRHSLHPVFSGNREIQLPKFFGSLLQKVPIHSVQGICEDTELLDYSMKMHGYKIMDRIDYDLMTLDSRPDPECFTEGPPDLILRKPADIDRERLFELQSAYEQEEVVPMGGNFSPESCRKTLEKLLKTEQMLVACLDGKIVGKINTNAKSYTRYQIGGVYVCPEFRGRGIAVKMSAVFLNDLIDEGRGISLYVKKRNSAARAVYSRLGFIRRGDYRISYY